MLKLQGIVVWGAWLTLSLSSFHAAAEQVGADAGVSSAGASTGEAPKPEREEEKPFWAGSSISWTQSASGNTVGLGQDFQSKNPTYDWAFSFSPVASVYEDKTLSVAFSADLSAFREFTNSDRTTREGEWEFGDVEVGAGGSLLLHKVGLYKTSLRLSLPNVTFPTSKASANNGKVLGLGTSLGLSQSFPLRGKDADTFQSISLSGSAGYSHTITEAVVPTNDGISRIRLTPGGQALPSDQLGAAAFAKHRASFTVSVGTSLTERVSFDAGFTWSPVWKYEFDNSVQVCSLSTGCVTPDRVSNPQTVNVIAGFTAGVGVQVFDAMSLALGYSNVTLQLGPDGQRRLPFYSPAARISLSVASSLDELYKLARGGEKSSRSPHAQVASR
ncbi:MAG: hypothetical protein SFV15_25880 [Polyangiaceae bacterium]|nr:hypothetical protein [Polyangiaceae bacterium]